MSTDWARTNVSGIILNGGASRRMGTDKASLVLGGRPLIERTLDLLGGLFDELLVVGRPIPSLASSSPLTRYASRGTLPGPSDRTYRTYRTDRTDRTSEDSGGASSDVSRITRHVPDAIPGAGPLGGIYTGLLAMTRPLGFFVACDMPCLDPEVIRRQIEVASSMGADAVVPIWHGYWEPLHALYSQECLPAARRQIESGDFRIRGFFSHVNVLFWDVLAEGISTRPFTNINTKSDLAALLGASAQRRTD